MAKTQKQTKPAGKARKVAKTTTKPAATRGSRPRDARLPAPGTTLTRNYKGKEVRVTVLPEGLRWDGRGTVR